MAELSQTRKAKLARRSRRNAAERKRFEGPLKEFIKIKHGPIYGDYIDFYEMLSMKYPNIRDLTKTYEFKKWARNQSEGQRKTLVDQSTQTETWQNPQEPDQTETTQNPQEPDQTETTQNPQEPDQTETTQNPQEPDQTETTQNPQEPDQMDPLTAAVTQTLPELISDQAVAAELDIVEELINELEQNETLREILDPRINEIMNNIQAELDDVDNANDDEGIEINYQDEILMDIEPFDYTLELELGEY